MQTQSFQLTIIITFFNSNFLSLSWPMASVVRTEFSDWYQDSSPTTYTPYVIPSSFLNGNADYECDGILLPLGYSIKAKVKEIL